MQLAQLLRGTTGSAGEQTDAAFSFPLAAEIAAAAVIVIVLWRLINSREARFWAWRGRGWRSALGAGLKMLALCVLATGLTAILPVLTYLFDVHPHSGSGVGFLIAEAVAAGLGSMTLAAHEAATRREVVDRGEGNIASWVGTALTACFVSLRESAKDGVRGRVAEALGSDAHRVRLLEALRDYAKDAGEDDESTIMLAVIFISDWPTLGADDRKMIVDTVRDFVVERRIARRRLIPENPTRRG